jgi:N-methylhydantoinase B
MNTPIEAFELIFPLRVKKYGIRDNSGGKGLYQGGDGIEKEIEFLEDSIVSVQSERRKFSPYGLEGGLPGKKGMNLKKKPNGEEEILPGRAIVKFSAKEILVLKTPGGGGYGKQ